MTRDADAEIRALAEDGIELTPETEAEYRAVIAAENAQAPQPTKSAPRPRKKPPTRR